jgi:glutamate N-acetyltransferase/amino-acid N-acetyltransferase
MHPLAYDVRVEGTLVCSGGYATGEQARFEGDEVEIEVALPGDGAEVEVFFSDLGHEYITINADYTT